MDLVAQNRIVLYSLVRIPWTLSVHIPSEVQTGSVGYVLPVTDVTDGRVRRVSRGRGFIYWRGRAAEEDHVGGTDERWWILVRFCSA